MLKGIKRWFSRLPFIRHIYLWRKARQPVFNFPPMGERAAKLTRLTMEHVDRIGLRSWR